MGSGPARLFRLFFFAYRERGEGFGYVGNGVPRFRIYAVTLTAIQLLLGKILNALSCGKNLGQAWLVKQIESLHHSIFQHVSSLAAYHFKTSLW